MTKPTMEECRRYAERFGPETMVYRCIMALLARLESVRASASRFDPKRDKENAAPPSAA